MKYKVLASKWRPKKFTEIVGQEHIVTTLVNSFTLGRIHHSYLLSGKHGIGKTTIARLVAKALNCKIGITATPCGQCKNCYEIENSNFLDLIEVDAASRTKVEDTRELLENIQYSSVSGRFKVYIIDEVHMLSRNSFNALLKTLEEPPRHVKFLLATTDIHKIPLTILSRCMHFHLKTLNIDQINNHLIYIMQIEKIFADPRALLSLAKAAQGSMRDALNLTDQAISIGHGKITLKTVRMMLGIVDINNQPIAILETLVNTNCEAMLIQIQQCASIGINWDQLIVEILSLLYHISIYQLYHTINDIINKNIQLRIHTLAYRISPSDLHIYYQKLLNGRKELPYAPNKRMGVEMILLRLLTFHPLNMNLSLKNKTIKNINSTLHDKSYKNITNKDILLEKISYNDINPHQKNILNKDQPIQILLKETKSPTSHILQARLALIEYKKKQIMNLSTLKTSSSTIQLSNKKQILQNHEIQKHYIDLESSKNIFAELIPIIINESKKHDAWTAQIYRLSLSKFAQQLAFNSWKEEILPDKICLHLRSFHRNLLKSQVTINDLCKELSIDMGFNIELNILLDDRPEFKTPLELYQMIYQIKLIKAHKIIKDDPKIKILEEFFHAKLDKNSIKIIK